MILWFKLKHPIYISYIPHLSGGLIARLFSGSSPTLEFTCLSSDESLLKVFQWLSVKVLRCRLRNFITLHILAFWSRKDRMRIVLWKRQLRQRPGQKRRTLWIARTKLVALILSDLSVRTQKEGAVTQKRMPITCDLHLRWYSEFPNLKSSKLITSRCCPTSLCTTLR